MRAEALIAAEWIAGIGEADSVRPTDPAIVRFVDRRGRTGYVALGSRVRRFVGLDDLPVAAPANEPAYRAATIH